MRTVFEDIELRVLGSHIKIPMIFLVPVMSMVSLYVIIYFLANSTFALRQTEVILHQSLGGHFTVQELVIEPDLSDVHLYGVEILDPDRELVARSREVHASVNTLLLLNKRLELDVGHLVGADVRMRIGKNGLNLLNALGVGKDEPKEPKPPSDGPPIAIHLTNLKVEDSRYGLKVDDVFEFVVEEVNIPHGEVHLDSTGLFMKVDRWRAPKTNFRFYRKLFGFPEEAGDWTFTMYDFDLKGWRWSNTGWAAEYLAANVEGYQVKIAGQMDYPGTEEIMTYKAEADVVAPLWSPLIQYFVRDAIHFDIPSLHIATHGSLQFIRGMAEVVADRVDVAGIIAEDVRARIALNDEVVSVEEGSAKFYGGIAKIKYAFFNLFQTRYGAEVSFQGVNPAGVLRSLGADLTFIDGKASGSLMAVGKVPATREFKLKETNSPLLEHTTDRWVEVTATEDITLDRDRAELVPARRVKMLKGSKAWVDLDRVVIPRASFRLDQDRVTLEDFSLNYLDMRLEDRFGPRGARVEANMNNLAPYLELYGVKGITSGPGRMSASAVGPLLTPDATLEASFDAPSYQDKVNGKLASAKIEVTKGRVNVKQLELDSPLGQASASGWIELLEPGRLPGGKANMPMYQPRKSAPANLTAKLRNIKLPILKPFLPRGVVLDGELNADAVVLNTLQRPLVCLKADVSGGEAMGQRIVALSMRGELRDKGVITACPGAFGLKAPEVAPAVRAVNLERLEVDLGPAGRMNANGVWRFDETFEGQVDARALDLSKLDLVRSLPIPVLARGDLFLRAKGSLKAPQVGGSLRLRDIQIDDLQLGDLALVINTTETTNENAFDGEDPIERTIHLTGALLPWISVAVEVPLNPQEAIYAKVGLDDMNVIELIRKSRLNRKFEGLGQLRRLRQLRLTGDLELFYYRDQDNPGFSVIATLPKLNVGPPELGLTNKETISLGYTRQDGPEGEPPITDRVTIEHFSLGADKKFLTLAGSYTPPDSFLDITTKGALDLSMVDALVRALPGIMPEEVSSMEGNVIVDAALSGTPSTLLADGYVEIGKTSVQLRSLSDPLVLHSGRVNFDRDQVNIDKARAVRGELLGGSFSMWGAVGLEQFKPSFADLSLWSHNMSYSVPDVASLTFDTNMRFEAKQLTDMSTWTVGGEVDFLDGLFYQNISVFEKELTGRVLGAFNRRTEVFEASVLEQLPELKKINLDLTVRARDGFRLKNQIERFDLDLEFRFDLRAYKTLADLGLSGEIEVIDGAIIFQGKRFLVRTGLVRFEGDPTNPFIDVVAGADIRNVCKTDATTQDLTPPIGLTNNADNDQQDIYHISLNVRGYPNNLNLLYESIPYVDQRDVISLILTGCTVDLLTASSASQPTLETILGPLIGRLEREIQDVVKVEEFTIVPGVQRTQVRISDSLTRRLSWKLQFDTQYNDASGQYAELQYKLTDGLSLQLSEGSITDQNATTNNTRLTVDLKLKFHLPLD